MSNILISLSYCPWLVAITLMLSSAHLVLISDLNLILIPHELIINGTTNIMACPLASNHLSFDGHNTILILR
jgi:hypothetical protein